jgi:catechol 2,3-dioxygenase-like lactoylglutathione lyase family enzyme/heme-degrading monooxygenase HmoA
MIARLWHGVTRATDSDAYWAFLHARAIPDYRGTPGNQGVRLFRRLEGDRAHFLTLSYWSSLEAVRAFAGPDVAVAKYYPEDQRFLLELEPTVVHYEVTALDVPGLPIDHVELFVPDRAAAAEWYARVLACRPVPGTEAWAADPRGPLMVSADGGRTKLALFQAEPHNPPAPSAFHRVAFHLTGAEWLAFVARLPELGLEENGTPARVVDHGGAWSAYFTDPQGHRLEVTTYDADSVRRAREP